jgi:hypothetical protein
MPSTVEIARSVRKSTIGSATDAFPLCTTPASTSASTAPVASFRADSAIAVCSIFCRIPIRSNSGMRIAGSVGATTAPMSSPVESGMSNATAATTPVTRAVMTTPGTARSPIPTATRLRIPIESCRPP